MFRSLSYPKNKHSAQQVVSISPIFELELDSHNLTKSEVVRSLTYPKNKYGTGQKAEPVSKIIDVELDSPIENIKPVLVRSLSYPK